MKKFMAAALVATMAFSVCACTNYSEEIQGEWTAPVYLEEDDNQENLESFYFYDDEIALLDLDGCAYIKYVNFNDDGTYEMGTDEDLSIESFKSYYQEVFNTLYENRTSISEYSDEAADIASAEDFTDWYATELFGFENGDDMITEMAETAYDYYTFDEEEGTYKADASCIYFTEDGEDETLQNDYTLEDDTLTIEGTDITLDFTRN